MTVTEALLESWDRQCKIVEAVASRIDESNRHLKPSEDGWPLDHQLAHMHMVRHFFLGHIAPERAALIGESFSDGWQTPITDLAQIKKLLVESGKAVREVMHEMFESGVQAVGSKNVTYDHPVLYLQHMIWHDGWHIGLIFLALRQAGQDPGEEWEEPNVWGLWRTETYES